MPSGLRCWPSSYQPGIGQVAFTVAGAPMPVSTDDGALTSDPVAIDHHITVASGWPALG